MIAKYPEWSINDNTKNHNLWLAYYQVLRALAPIMTPSWFSPLGD